MCISCRKREPQQELIRLQKDDTKIVKYRGFGRSFYICKKCLENKHLEKKISKIVKVDIKKVEELIKELRAND